MMNSSRPNTLAGHLSNLLPLLAVNCILDVGAHEGAYVRLLRAEVGFRGEIVSFEPAWGTYAALESRFSDDRRWRGHRYALGRRQGRLGLHVYGDTLLNSFLSPSEYGVHQFPVLSSPVSIEDVEVHSLTEVFDSVTSHVSDARVFLKADTQGFDLEVVEGAVDVLDRIVGLQLELPVKPIYQDMPTLSSTLDRLYELGFGLTGMFPVSLDRDGLQVIEFDCVFYRLRETVT
jgi:FkbM family methyltransferase